MRTYSVLDIDARASEQVCNTAAEAAALHSAEHDAREAVPSDFAVWPSNAATGNVSVQLVDDHTRAKLGDPQFFYVQHADPARSLSQEGMTHAEPSEQRGDTPRERAVKPRRAVSSRNRRRK